MAKRRKFEVGRNYDIDKLSGRKEAIEIKCLDCCANDWAEAKSCKTTSCPLYPWGLAVAKR